MKKIVPFKKEIIFKTNLSEITSISLEHSLHYEKDNLISGEFIISGEYRMNDNSPNTEPFSYNIPFDINMDERYILDKAVIDINDFYYEIINSKVLDVNIEVSIDKLEEQPLIIEEELIEEPQIEHELLDRQKPEVLEETFSKEEKTEEAQVVEEPKVIVEPKVVEEKKVVEKRCVEEEDIGEVSSLFDSLTNEETYVSYRICIIREGDNLESIMTRYNVSKEILEMYNDLNELKIGDKLIIPSVNS